MFKKSIPIIFVGLSVVVAMLVLGWVVFVKIDEPVQAPVVDDGDNEIVIDDVGDDDIDDNVLAYFCNLGAILRCDVYMLDVDKDSVGNPDNYGWREGAFKSIILMGDAPPQGGPESYAPELWDGGHTLDNVTYWSENIDPIRVYSIVVGSDPDT